VSYADDHVQAFNHAVTTGDWKTFTDRFAEDAVLEFVGPPVGPFIGREAILDAYTEHPPEDTIEIRGPVVETDPDIVIPYAWTTTDATGSILITLRAHEIARLKVTFD
jgi:ketosteroid isomerase-like protein